MNRTHTFLVFLLPAMGAALAGVFAGRVIRPDATLDWVLSSTVALAAAALAAAAIRWIVQRRLHQAAREAAQGQIGLSAAVPGLLPLLEALRDSRGEAHWQSDALQQTGAQLTAVLEGMQDAVLALDTNQRIVFANQTAVELLSLPKQGAEGRPLLQAVRDHRISRLVSECRSQKKTQSQELLLSGCHIEVCVTPQAGDPCPGVVLVLHDVTHVKRLEAVRRDFVTNVSHELKTPLSGIRAYAETLRDGAMQDDAVRNRFLDKITEQADRLNELILDLISLARIESGRQTFEVVDLPVRPVVESCLSRVEEAAEQREVALRAVISAEAVVRADEEALRQILDNLLDNAIKYAAGGAVSVTSQIAEDAWELRVSDTGVGIPAKHLPRLFERFYRVDRARARELGGTGLGLAIVKHLAHAFEGSVGVESEVGVGSTFWVRLPAAAEVPSEAT